MFIIIIFLLLLAAFFGSTLLLSLVGFFFFVLPVLCILVIVGLIKIKMYRFKKQQQGTQYYRSERTYIDCTVDEESEK